MLCYSGLPAEKREKLLQNLDKVAHIFIVIVYYIFVTPYTAKKRKLNFPHIQGNSDGIRCKVKYEEGLPNIRGNAQIFSPYVRMWSVGCSDFDFFSHFEV